MNPTRQTVARPNAVKQHKLWKIAELKELRSLESSKTWNVVVRPNGAKLYRRSECTRLKRLGNGDYD